MLYQTHGGAQATRTLAKLLGVTGKHDEQNLRDLLEQALSEITATAESDLRQQVEPTVTMIEVPESLRAYEIERASAADYDLLLVEGGTRRSQKLQQAVIGEYLKQLRLPSGARRYEELARQAANPRWSYEDYLRELLEAEVLSRQERRAERLLKGALFPDIKILDQINWGVLGGVSRTKILELASCGFIEKTEDVVIAGPIGKGKTHLAIGLGVEATGRRKRVAFVRAASLVRSLIEARDERMLGRLEQKLRRVDLLIIDELGFVLFDRIGGELLFNLLSERYERGSTMVTTNLSFGEWVQVFAGDEKLTTALLDRLSHHAHILTTKGGSYRRQEQARKKKAGDKKG